MGCRECESLRQRVEELELMLVLAHKTLRKVQFGFSSREDVINAISHIEPALEAVKGKESL
jgi:hypothetical protein